MYSIQLTISFAMIHSRFASLASKGMKTLVHHFEFRSFCEKSTFSLDFIMGEKFTLSIGVA